MSVAVSVKNVCKNFMLGQEEVKVLKELTFNIEQGEFVSLMGLLVQASPLYYT